MSRPSRLGRQAFQALDSVAPPLAEPAAPTLGWGDLWNAWIDLQINWWTSF